MSEYPPSRISLGPELGVLDIKIYVLHYGVAKGSTVLFGLVHCAELTNNCKEKGVKKQCKSDKMSILGECRLYIAHI